MNFHGALMFASLALSGLCAAYGQPAASKPNIDDAFIAFITKHGRTYVKDTKEYEMRKGIFATAAQKVETHNQKPGKSWQARINKLSDRTPEELARLRGWKGGNRPGKSAAPDGPPSTASYLTKDRKVMQLPEEHTWTNLTSVKEIQDQGGCGSCWAFASATVLRAHSEIWMGSPRKFSVQQIISCTANPQECGGTGGCQGATAELAMDYVYKHGCRTEYEFPYTETDDQCPHSLLQEPSLENEPAEALASASLGMIGWEKLPENRVIPLKSALVLKGPVAVSISAGYSWNQYDGGVLDDCPKDAVIDHAVVLIGYGKSKVLDGGADLKYWHLQNSWGTDWGENGYLRMLRFEDSYEETTHCGWDNDPQIGSGCKGGPPEVHVCGMCGLLYDTVIPHFADKRSLGSVKQHNNFLQIYH